MTLTNSRYPFKVSFKYIEFFVENRMQNFSVISALPSQQRGASVSGIVFFILALGIFVKLGLATIPAQIGDYQLTKSIAIGLKKANDNKETPQQFLSGLESQWNINNERRKPADIFTITDPTPGSIKVHKDYSETKNLFGNVDVVSHFKGDITAADVK